MHKELVKLQIIAKLPTVYCLESCHIDGFANDICFYTFFLNSPLVYIFSFCVQYQEIIPTLYFLY